MSDDEMFLNITANDTFLPKKRKIISFENENEKQEPNKKKFKANSKNDKQQNKFKQISSHSNRTNNKSINKNKRSVNYNSLHTDLRSLGKQTKEEIEEKNKEIFEDASSSIGFESINQRMRDNLEKHLNITKPTKVQLKSLPYILQGKDVLMKSKTGSGKTLAYLLPCLHLLQKKRTARSEGTYMIIVAPTRELAIQITEVANVLLKQFPWLVFGSLMGGLSKKKEKARLRKGLSVVVATPGRLLDHLENTASFNVSNVSWMILDEADRLLDLGFEKALKKIIATLDERSKLPNTAQRQNLLISATLEGRIKKLANVSLKSPIYVNLSGDDDLPLQKVVKHHASHQYFDENDNDNIDTNEQLNESDNEEEVDDSFQVPKHLLQSYCITETKQKLVALISFLRLQSFSSPDTCKILIFVLTTDIVEFLYSLFTFSQFENEDEEGNKFSEDMFAVPIFKLHGNMSQQHRTSMFIKYRACSCGILFCTDVAARGLDVPNIKWIIQYDAPTETKEYVHRIGRTARFTGQGKSIIFLTPSEKEYVNHLAEHQLQLKEIYLEVLLNTLQIPVNTKRRLPSYVRLQEFLENVVNKDKKLYEKACSAFRSYTRGYATYPKDLKFIFHVKSLHLGHVTKMFALTESPNKLDNVKSLPKNTKQRKEEKYKKTEQKKANAKPNASQRILSEFSAW